jgi:hypothetical protein
MSNATVVNRFAFQTSTTNGNSTVNVLPNGTSLTSAFHAHNNSDPTNASFASIGTNGTEVQIQSGIRGTGTYLPLTMFTNGSERLRVTTAGDVGIGTSNPAFPFETKKTGTDSTIWGYNVAQFADATANQTGLRIGTNTSTSGLTQLVAATNSAASQFGFWTYNGSSWGERMRIDSAGNVGINRTPNTWISTYKTIQGGSAAGGPSGQPTSGSISFRTDFSQTYLYAGGYRDAAGNQAWAATNSSNNYVQLYGMDSFNGFHQWQISNSDNGTAGGTATMQTVLGANATGSVFLLGGITSANGTGITFPATQNASSNANTLDDYEEGTWTPTLTRDGTAPTLTYSTRQGTYTKIGRVVTASLTVIVGTVSSAGTGNTTITGLPFSNGDATYSGQGSIGYNTAFVSTIDATWMSSTTMFFRAGTRSDGNDASGWSSGGYLNITITYQTT